MVREGAVEYMNCGKSVFSRVTHIDHRHHHLFIIVVVNLEGWFCLHNLAAVLSSESPTSESASASRSPGCSGLQDRCWGNPQSQRQVDILPQGKMPSVDHHHHQHHHHCIDTIFKTHDKIAMLISGATELLCSGQLPVLLWRDTRHISAGQCCQEKSRWREQFNIQVSGTYGDVEETVLYGVFNTPPNSIGGSAVCSFRLADISSAFEGQFKEQRNTGDNWLAVDPHRVPSPRPGKSLSWVFGLYNVKMIFLEFWKMFGFWSAKGKHACPKTMQPSDTQADTWCMKAKMPGLESVTHLLTDG